MTRSIEETPIEERALLVQARLDEQTLALIRDGLPEPIGRNEVTLVLGPNYADVPIGTTFDCCYARGDETRVSWVKSGLVAVTQQLARPWREIPHGWKTISVLRFDPGVPDLIAQLPEASGWVLSASLFISSRETWEARRTAI